MREDFTKLGARCLQEGRSNIHWISIIAQQGAFEVVEVAKVEKVAPGIGGAISHESREHYGQDTFVEDNDKYWIFNIIMTAENVKASGLKGKVRALQEK